MTSVGVMASAVVPPAVGVDVLMEPFNSMAAWTNPFNFFAIKAGGRTGNCTGGSGTCDASWAIPAVSQSDTLTIGVAVRVNTLVNNREVLYLQSDAGSTLHTSVVITSTGAVQVLRGQSFSLGQSAAGLCAVNAWSYLEIQIRLHDTAGTLTVKREGVTIIGLLTGLDTKNGGTKATYDTVRIVSTSGGAHDFDDMYVTMGAGAPFKGPIAIP